MILNRFQAGKGVLLDMEYLTDFKGTQLVTKSAGFWAGICGAAITIKIWVQKKQGKTPPFVVPEYYLDYQSLIEELKNSILQVDHPKILIIGPHGMSGSGVRTFLAKMGLNYTEWTRMHTQSTGPYVDILNFDMMFNCIMINNQTPVFLTKESLKRNNKLSIISDISCDPDSPYNPLPLYEHPTSFANPTIRLSENGYPVDIIAIDHITTQRK
jgi:saccharopine dehydrogenase (NAD+, L-lysine-forming)